MVSPGGGERPKLRFDPIRAITYADQASLPKVTSPPYDVVGTDGVSALEAADPHNVVRLILPRSEGDEDRYHHAAHDLTSWFEAGVLSTDTEPALWVYRHVTSTGSAVGLVGAVGLDGPVLPHESTFDGPVADRVALMTVTGAQLEPILLTYHGNGAASDAVDAALGTTPTIAAVMDDGSRHDLWRLADPAVIAAIQADLADRQALIADGHHRFAAYRRVHATQGTSATGTGLAVLVDAARHPLELRGVHRVVAGITLDDAVTAATRSGFTVLHGGDSAAHTPGEPPQGTFTLTDGAGVVRIRATDSTVAAMPTNRSARWGSVDAAVLKHALIGAAWGIDDADAHVAYVHEENSAVSLARRLPGVAALIASPALDDVMALAEAGEKMPQKSTSFGPKPRTGLIMRWTN